MEKNTEMKCLKCNGDGALRVVCGTCLGDGRTNRWQLSGDFQVFCHGTGERRVDVDCTFCDGSGEVELNEITIVKG